jgi:putative membrane protein
MFFTLLVKGFIIGFSFTIPGASGGTFAVYLGVFDKMVAALGNLFKDFRRNFAYLFPLGLGLVLGIGLFAKLMGLALRYDSFVTIMFFIGMTIGGVPSLYRNNLKGKRAGTSGILALCGAVVFILLMAVFQILSGNGGTGYFEMSSLSTYPLLFILGVASAMTMIVPGISGSALLLILGYYTAIVSNVAGNLTDVSALGYNVAVMVPFAIGALAGVIGMSKAIETLLRKHPVQSYMAIIGFVVASSAFLLLWIRDPGTADVFIDQTPVYTHLMDYVAARPWDLVFGLATLLAGLFGSLLIVRFGGRTSVPRRTD